MIRAKSQPGINGFRVTMPLRDRLLVQMAPAKGCWNWHGQKTSNGYPRIRVKQTDGAWKNRSAHRLAYEFFIGPIPTGLTLDHLCRNRACVNPAHLEPVTMRENTLRGTSEVAINARKTRCPLGHEYDVVSKAGKRRCHACGRLEGARARARAKWSGGELPAHLAKRR